MWQTVRKSLEPIKTSFLKLGQKNWHPSDVFKSAAECCNIASIWAKFMSGMSLLKEVVICQWEVTGKNSVKCYSEENTVE